MNISKETMERALRFLYYQNYWAKQQPTKVQKAYQKGIRDALEFVFEDVEGINYEEVIKPF